MAKKVDRTRTDLVKVKGVAALLAMSQEDDSLTQLGEYVIVPFVKVIQGQTETELKDKCGEGSAVLRPGDSILATKKAKFKFVPLFFYVQYRKWCDRRDTGNMIAESSFDPTSEVAKRAKDSKLWSEVYPGQEDKTEKEKWVYRYVEHLCFVGVIHGEHDLAGTQCQISFQKGDFRVGRGFISGISQRKQRIEADGDTPEDIMTIPLWAQIWEFSISQRDRGGNKWWGFDPAAPEDGASVIDPDLFAEHKDAYETLKKAHADNLLKVDGDDSGQDEKEIPADSKDF